MLYTPDMLRKDRVKARPSLGFVEPRFVPWVYTFMRLAVWCVEDLRRQERNEEVLILPVACQYLYREQPKRLLDRLIEYALNLNDVINRLMGGQISSRYSPPGKTVRIRIGEPIKVKELYPLIPGRQRKRADGLMKIVVSRLEQLSRKP